jgi:hypothetical protein
MKPVFAAQTDFIDEVRLLIPRNLLKAQECPDNPAYSPIRQILRFFL